MDTKVLEDLVGKLTANVDELKRQVTLSQGEHKDRIDKIATDFAEMQTALRKVVDRKTAGLDVDPASAGRWLGREGGFKDIREVKQVQLYERDDITGLTTHTPAVPDNVKQACRVMDEVYICDTLATMKYGRVWYREKEENEREAFCKRFPSIGYKHDAIVQSLNEYHGKALATGTAGSGSEWVPTGFSSNLLDLIRLANPVVNLIPHINMPRSPWLFPLLNTVNTAYRKTENTAITASDLGTLSRTWTAHVHAVYQAYSDEMDDDSIVAIASAVRIAVLRAMSEGLDEALVNGDVDNAAHFDNDYITASAPFRTYQGGMSGLRQYALDAAGTGTDNSVDGGANAIVHTDVGAALATMSKFAAGKIALGDVVALVTAEQWIQLLTEASSPIMTVDKYGAAATILTGEVGRIFGVPIFVSYGVEQRKNSVAATGQNTVGGPNTLSCAVVFNRQNFRIGDRRDVRFETDKDITAGRNDVVVTARWALQNIEGDTTDANWDPQGTPSVCVIRNID
jgi:hypothetical protein